jgi:hypothetical protein
MTAFEKSGARSSSPAPQNLQFEREDGGSSLGAGLKQPHDDLRDREPPHPHSRSNGQAPEPEEDPAKPGSLSYAEFDAEIQRLAALNGQRYERQREAAAKRLGLGVGRLDKLVNAERKNSAEDSKQGRPLSLSEPEPWSEPVNGAELLEALAASIRRYVVSPTTGLPAIKPASKGNRGRPKTRAS